MTDEIKNENDIVETPQGVEEVANAPTKGAGKAEPMGKVDGEVQDLGPAVVKPTDKPGQDKADDKIKKDSSAPTKGAAAPEPMAKVKEEAEDESNQEIVKEAEMPKTKSGMIQAMYDSMNKMKKADIAASYNKIMSAMHGETDEKEDEDPAEEKKVNKEAVETRVKSIDVSDDVNALVSGDDSLSEEFKTKAATIFEAAVKSKVKSEIVRLEGEYENELAEAKETVKEELTVKVDNYLNYVVEQWMTDNELAIEKGIKGEIAEDFIAGLKTLFEDHYIDVPDEKYDVLEAKEKELEEMKSKVNEMTEKAVADKKLIEGYTKDEIFESAVEGMADTEKEKMKSLVEDVAFEGADAYSKKLSTIKESYFGSAKEAPASTENVDTVKDSNDGNTVADMSDSMARYTAAISRGKSRDIYGK
jgi:hypothetical protein|tara:strand:- start:109 stop:1359 length:1251 start_codon:yes stop_codon:yes gene_type:complete